MSAPAGVGPEEPLRRQLPDGPAVWCSNGPAAVAMWREMLPPGAYDRVARRLRDGDTVVDVGANIGLLSVLCARTRSRIRVVAAEPAPALHACLVRNLAEYAAPGWAAECAAVADRPGRLRFTYYPEAPGNSGLHADRGADDEITLAFLRNSGWTPRTRPNWSKACTRASSSPSPPGPSPTYCAATPSPASTSSRSTSNVQNWTSCAVSRTTTGL
jgi:FkbM family methyltransferase